MFAFFGLDPIHWLILLVMGLVVIGVPVLVVALVLSQQRRAAGGGRLPVKVRCQKCEALNDEAAKYCNQCGSPI
jgi:hypothetical protein